MTEEQTATAQKPPEAAPEGDTPPVEEQRVPYHRFEEVNGRAKRAEKQLEDLQQRIVEFEERDKSEAERAKSRAERAESQLKQLQGTVTAMQKGSWVRSAAAELGFHDPEDAIAHLGERLAGLEDERDAKRAVKTLAQSKKHLVRDEKKDDRPRIGRVFSAEDRAQNEVPNGQRPISHEQANAMREAEFAQSLAAELNQFRSNWREMGGLTP